MTSDANTTPRTLVRPFVFMVAALLAMSFAGVTARAALAGPKPRYLSSARSLDLLRTAYGATAERSFREPRIVVAPTSAATWAFSDQVNIANHVWNPKAGRLWAPADAKAMWPEDLGGFTNPANGDVYINAHTAVESAMPHELLHANASPDFLQTFGVAVNEGVTEQLALDAMAASGIRAEKVPAYAGYRALAAAIVSITGRDRLVGAYFNGGQALADFVSALGPGTAAQLKTATAGTDTGQALRLLESAATAAA